VREDYNWTVVQLAAPAYVAKVVVDTLHFRNNSPVACAIEVARAATPEVEAALFTSRDLWHRVVKPTPLRPHHEVCLDVQHDEPVTHVLLKIFPCGGVSRLRVFGRPASKL
jgi:allantoicase